MSSDLLTLDCVEKMKVNLPVGHQFLARVSFDPWVGVNRHPTEEIYNSLFKCYTAYYFGHSDEWRARMSSGQATFQVDSSSASVADVGSVGVSDNEQGASVATFSSKAGGRKNQRPGKFC